ncbi:hypothetical protein JCM9140_321 [Halalkalibacter wakoensis JCM 9140]|uniref:Uncharacterized protein n=1 Tax=Halalkalibacter wakoensis JCM 9140 TaxID=1236970 RepID=W4PX37_9BACI|nr:hypothetical protein [Halalkalibacter wakoensis]GAE24401.1 hypothetical protein JCM9140_321 [Halalkalibacter wakoensis JCM 9140]
MRDDKKPRKLIRTVRPARTGREGIDPATGSDYWLHKDVMEEDTKQHVSDELIIYNEDQTCEECGKKLPTKDELSCQDCIMESLLKGEGKPDGKIY